MKTVLVTGAAGGMGSAVCKKLLSDGFNVLAVDIKPLNIENVKSYCCDITDTDSLNKLRDEITGEFKKIDCIVHTAGIYDLDSLTEIDDKRFVKIFEINLFGVYRINRLFTPYMEKGGRITIITSELAPLNPLPFTGIYAVTKAALEKYAYSLRSELALRGISLSIVRPGAVKTGLLGDSTSALEKFVEKTDFYKPNAARFKKIVDTVEAKSVSPDKVADKVYKSLTQRRPRYVYNLNRNPLLKIMSALPDHLQILILKAILK